MTDFDNTNRGVLFKNSRKTTDKHPDYTGSINVGGKEFYLDAWIKESKKGEKFMSLSCKSKDAVLVSRPRGQREPGEDNDGSAPF